MDPCNCPDPKLCQRLKQHINGRLWEIWSGINIDPKTAAQYRTLWERQAGLKGGLADAEPKSQPVAGRPCNCGR
jgi:hypothetical protein